MSWENKPRTMFCFAAFMLTVYYIEPWLITLALIVPFIKNIIVSNKLSEIISIVQ